MPSRQPAHIHAARHCSGQRNRRQGKRVCLLCRQAVKSCTPSTVSRSQPRGPVYSACSQGAAGGGACNHTMQRGPVWHNATTPQRIHAAHALTMATSNVVRPSACSAKQAVQIRPETRFTGFADSPYVHHTQRIARATCGHFKRFSHIPVNARQCSTRFPRPAARS